MTKILLIFKIYKIMKIFIYALINPENNQVVYVGKTPDNLDHYLKTKYWKLNEVKKGGRNWTKLFRFLDELLPKKVEIKLLYICDTEKKFTDPDIAEIIYIDKYRKINPNLLNEADGGTGGYTLGSKTKEEINEIGKKISSKLKGRKKPNGFSEHLSIIRRGKNNPSAKLLNPKIAAYANFSLIKVFDYGFEINAFVKSKHGYSNVFQSLTRAKKNNTMAFGYGYRWEYLNS